MVARSRSGDWPLGTVLERLEPRLFLSGGNLDPSFGNQGFVPLSSPVPYFGRVLLQPDGKVLRAGTLVPNAGNSQVVVERFNTDGSPDLSFGSAGLVVTDFLAASSSLQDLSLLPDGDIQLTASVPSASFAVERFNPDGSPDSSFGVNGIFVAPALHNWFANPYDSASSWVGGQYVIATLANFTGPRLILQRLNPDGSLDPSFATGGELLTSPPFGGGDKYVDDILARPDGSFLVEGHYSETSTFYVLGISAAGQTLFSFTSSPNVGYRWDNNDYVLHQLALLPNGQFYAFSYDVPGSGSPPTPHPSVLSRYNFDGSIDSSFGTNGSLSLSTQYTQPVLVVLPDGSYKIISNGGPLALYPDGSYVMNSGQTLARYFADDSLDPSFAARPIPVGPNLPSLPYSRQYSDVAVQPDAKVVAVGSTGYLDMLVSRFNPDGSPDPSFGAGGHVILNLAVNAQYPGFDAASSVLLQPDGRILVGGYAHANSGNFRDPNNSDFALVRLLPDGSLDPSFGNAGIVTMDFGAATDSISRIALQPSGDIIVLGNSRTAQDDPIMILRYLPDGSLDPTFGSAGHILPGSINDIAVQPDGRILAAGSTSVANTSVYLVRRYTADGLPDPSFGSGGSITIDPDFNYSGSYSSDVANCLLLQPDGNILVGGTTSLLRLTPAGLLDQSFAPLRFAATRLALLPDSSIMALNNPGPYSSYWSIAHVLPTGESDPNFNSSAVISALSAVNQSNPNAVVAQPDGRVLIAGRGNPFSYSNALLARLYPSDSPRLPFTLSPQADTWAGNLQPDAVHGSDPALYAQRQAYLYYPDSLTYLRFDLSHLSTLASATLRLFASLTNPVDSSVPVALYAVPDSNWTESSLTYASRPAHDSTPIATFTVSSTSPASYDIDLTAYLQSLLAAGKSILSLAIQPLAPSDGPVRIASREAVSGSPELILSTSPLCAPASLTVSVAGAHRVDLSWTATDPHALAYRIETGSGTSWSLLATVPASVTSYSDFLDVNPYPARNPVTYSTRSYRVLALDRDSLSPPSNVATATIPHMLADSTFTSVTDPFGTQHLVYFHFNLDGYSSLSQAQFRLFSWLSGGSSVSTPVSLVSLDMTGFSSYSTWTWDHHPAVTGTLSTLTLSGADRRGWQIFDLTSYLHDQVAAGHTSVDFALSWTDPSGGSLQYVNQWNSTYGDVEPELDFTAVPTPVPAASVSVSATDLDSQNAWLTWSPVPGETSYAVESSSDGTTFTTAIASVDADHTFSLVTGSPGSTVYFRVRAVNLSGSSSPSPVVAVYFPPASVPTHATFLADGSVDAAKPDSSSGTSDLVVAPATASAGPQIAYVKYDVSSFPIVGRAYLSFDAWLGWDVQSFSASVHLVPDSSWSHDTLTWNTRPAIDPAPLDSLSVQNRLINYHVPLLFDVTSAVRAAAAAGQSVLSFAVESDGIGTAWLTPMEQAQYPAINLPSLFVSSAPDNQVPLSGTPFGTPGSWNNSGNTFLKVFDSNPSTFFDAPTSTAFVGLDLGSARVVSSVSFLPRSGLAWRMLGGRFQGSNDNASWTDLAAVTALPPDSTPTSLRFSDPTPYRYVRYLSPDGGFGNIAELQFFTPASAPSPSAPVYLSDLAFLSASNGYGPVERDSSNGEQAAGDGHTLSLHGVTYAKGLGVHAPSDLLFNLAGAYSTFQADIGIDDEVAPNGSVDFQVFADNLLLFDSGTVTSATPTQHLSLDLTNRHQLRLIVTPANDGSTSDHADWANALLLPTTPSTPIVHLTVNPPKPAHATAFATTPPTPLKSTAPTPASSPLAPSSTRLQQATLFQTAMLIANQAAAVSRSDPVSHPAARQADLLSLP